MGDNLRMLSLRGNIDSLITAITGCIFVFILIKYHGVGISPDSVSYASVARNIKIGGGLVEFDGNPLIIFPAGYPAFLGALSYIFSTDVLVIVPWVNAFLVGIVIYMYGCMMSGIGFKYKWQKWATLSILPASFAIMDVYTMLWSETLFMALLSFFMITLKKYLCAPSLPNLIVAALFTAFSCDTRIAGITILATGLLLILIKQQPRWGVKILHLLIFLVISCSIIAVNLLRNLHEDGTMTGIRQHSTTPFSLNLQYVGETILLWMQLPNNNASIALLVAIAVLALMICFAAYRCFSKGKLGNYQTINLVFGVTYICFIVLTATISKYEKINNRLLFPAFLPLVLSVSFLFLGSIDRLKTGLVKTMAMVVLGIFFLLFQYKQTYTAMGFKKEVEEMGIPGYTELTWQESDIVQFLKTRKSFFTKGATVYSNTADAAYFFGGLPASTLPEPAHKNYVKEYLREPSNYIIWFTNEFDNKEIMRLDEIAKYRRLDTLARFRDGMVLWCKPKP